MRLLDCCKISNQSVSKYEGTRKYIATGDIINNNIVTYEEYYYDNKPSRANLQIEEGTVIFAKMKDTIKVLIGKKDNKNNIYSTGFCSLIPNDNILSKYLFYYLNSESFNNQKNKYSSGATQQAINNEKLKKIMIKEVPPLEKQKEIIKKLDTITSLMEYKKIQIDKLNELIKSQFVEMFENDILEKSFLNSFARISSSKRIYANEYKNTGIPFYRSKEIRELGTGLKPSVELFIDEQKYNQIKSKFGVPKKGDILIAAIGATIGYMWIVDESKFYYKDGNLINISPFDKVNSIYLKYVLEKIITDYKIKNASGSAQLAMTIEKMEKFEIPIPPIELQNKFADIVKQIDKQKFVIENSLENIGKLVDLW